jgi:VWFA-related protein
VEMHRHRTLALAVFSLLLLSCPPPLIAQASPDHPVNSKSPEVTRHKLEKSQDTESTYTLKVKSRIVVLDIVVTDKHGALVDHLTKDDFEIREDKVPQTISSLEHTRPAPQTAQDVPIHSTAELDRLKPNAPVNILVLDEMNTRFEDEAFTRYSLQQYLKGKADVLEQPTMLIAVDVQHFMVLRDYTTSKSDILSALNHHLAVYPWQVDNGSLKHERFNASFASLIEIAEATAGHPGHKNMIWIGRGFPSINMENFSPNAADALKSAIQQCTNMLRDSRITLNTIDPAGVSAITTIDSNGFEEDPFGGQVNFNSMATATGGRVFRNRNDVDAMVDRSVREGADFYTLSYTPLPVEDRDPDKPFRSIKIVMKDHDLHAITRAGYYESEATAAKPPDRPGEKPSTRVVFDLSVAISSTMVYDGVPFTLTRDQAHPDDFHLGLRSSDVDWHSDPSGKEVGEVAIFVESFDRKDKLVNRAAHSLNLERHDSANVDAAVEITATIPTQPPAARLRFVLRVGSSGKIGADNFYLVDRSNFADPSSGLKPEKR